MADIKEITNRWLARNTKVKGVLACGVRYADQTTFNQISSPAFSSAALDNSWGCVASTFDFLKQQKSEVDQMCWVFERYHLFCAQRPDGTCLGVYVAKGEDQHDPAAVNKMIAEFKTLRAGGATR
jgi:hypothetical protein